MHPDSRAPGATDQIPEEHPNGGASDCRSVGIFWFVPGDSGGALIWDRLQVGEAEVYGDCLTHPRGHYEIWERWRGLGPGGRRRAGIPEIVARAEYEVFPRGRVVFSTSEQTFWVYADRRLQRPEIVAEIKEAFGLRDANCVIRSDTHYA